MTLREIEERVAAIEPRPGVEYLGDLLLAYGLPRASVSRLMSGTYDKADTADERLWKDKVYFRYIEGPDEALYEAIDAARGDERVIKHRPRFLIVKNDVRLLARDQKDGQTRDIEVGELASNVTFFGAWAGFEKTQLENLNYADRRAAERMAKLYDEIIRHNSIETDDAIHNLNVFFSRLLFCFFAEDTGVFEQGSFTNALGSYTRESGEDTHEFLDRLFDVLDTAPAERLGLTEHLRGFGHVNGNLFERRSPAPRFSAKARAVILECGTLDWSQINPDIFGSMIQAVVHPGQRAGLGMHYTSVENIMKVIRPLFLDDLEEAFDAAGTVKKLDALLARIAAVQIFDPACGSGNFLVIAYKELRRLEHRILQRTIELEPHRAALFADSRLRLDNFYGIEIDDFAHEIAILSLWLAKHQMNAEFKELFGAEIPLIPLREAGRIVCENAARIDWTEVCAPTPSVETYICGNPPYLGSRNQTPSHKSDLQRHHSSFRSLDYVVCWIVQSAAAVIDGRATAAALVSTNSVTQGEQVGLLWPSILESGVAIDFAHTSFRWSNDARANAGVTCVILGLRRRRPGPRRLYSATGLQHVDNISPYLVGGRDTTVGRRSKPINGQMPVMSYGCLLNDGGNLILSSQTRSDLLAEYPTAERWIRPLVGSRELLEGLERWCLKIPDEDVEEARNSPVLANRLRQVAAQRQASSEASTRKLAPHPNRFYFSCYQEAPAIIVPGRSSERRDYVPMDFVPPGTVVSNLASVIYGAEAWLFALLQSRMHMTWVRAVAGRMESRYRYSAVLVYNNFPVPDLSDETRAALTSEAVATLTAREQYSGHTLAELYDPAKMPPVLRSAHRNLDDSVDALYRPRPFDSDTERLELLFEMYEAAMRDEPVTSDA